MNASRKRGQSSMGRLERQRRQLKRRRWILAASFFLASAAWVFGYFNSGTEVLPLVSDVLPGATRIESRGNYYLGLNDQDEIIGFAATGEEPGYCGPITVLVGVNPAGEILGMSVINHCESPGFFRLLENQGFLSSYTGLSYDQPLIPGDDLDTVSGATLSVEGTAGAVREAVQDLSQSALNDPLPPERKKVKFGWPEISLLALYIAGYVGHKIRGPWKKRIRWGTLLSGMVILGFIYTAPITIAQIIAFLSGYWPDWHHNLYWYLLIGGILFVTTVDAKNPYCSWFCPFGAFQETLAQITNAPIYKPRKWREAFTWMQRGLAFSAVLLGFALRNPGVAGFEPFATLFDLRGTLFQWMFLIVVTIASLVMYRPFCNYLCPIDPAVDLISEVRKWVLEVWKKWRKREQ